MTVLVGSFTLDPKRDTDLCVSRGRETLGSPWEPSVLLDVLALLCESAQQDKPIPKHWFALARVCSSAD